ncbi:MAG: DNA polymerase III subunit epsilon [Rhodocyclaceae bacterium]|nr:DNA polymerase III subunit epsilon [Rhodocyclaceae bacterium]
MRQVVLDTETTGLEVTQGHRIVEVAAVELIDRRLSGRHFHRYLNPQRSVEQGALRVHGLDEAFLADKPLFADIAAELADFLRGAQLIIHNAPFDMGFLNAEFERVRLERPDFERARLMADDGVSIDVLDTLPMARELHPGKRNSLDALCERYGVDNSGRTFHGALLDAELLAEVYLAMTRGQESLITLLAAEEAAGLAAGDSGLLGLDIVVLRATDVEVAAHEALLAGMGGKVPPVWMQ